MEITLRTVVSIIYLVTFLFITNGQITQSNIEELQKVCPNYSICSIRHVPASVVDGRTGNQSVTGDGCCRPGCHCDADLGVCIGTGNCCAAAPGRGEGLVSMYESSTCVSPSFNFDPTRIYKPLSADEFGVSQARLGLTMINMCPEEVNETRCSHPNASDLFENQPVTDILTHVTYRNKYCALCNAVNETEYAPWAAFVSCSSLEILKSDNLLFPSNVKKIFSSSVKPNTKFLCGFEFMPPNDETQIVEEDMCILNSTVVSKCPDNVTHVSAEIVQACGSMYLPYLSSNSLVTTVYANYFCFLCNSGVNAIELSDTAGNTTTAAGNTTTAAGNTTNAAGNTTTAAGNTTTEAAPAHSGRCPSELEFVIHAETLLVAELNTGYSNESNILPAWEQDDLTPARYVPSGVKCKGQQTYDIFLEECRDWFCPNGRMPSADGECVPIYVDVVKGAFSVTLQMHANTETREKLRDADLTNVTEGILGKMYGNHSGTTTEIILLAYIDDYSYIFAFVLIHISPLSVNKGVIYDRNTYGKEMFAETDNGTLPLRVNFAVGIKMELNTFPLSDIILVDMLAYKALRTVIKANVSEIEHAFQYTVVSRLSFCTQIALERNEVRDYIDVVDIRISDTRIYSGEFARAARYETVRVCLKDYFRKAEHYYQQKLAASMYTPQAILSVVCNLLSMAGLCITIITYIIFEELRTIPGKNNMMLAVHLLIAQCLYQFGMDRTDLPNACVVLGIFIHLFWLTAIFWMNVCTLHMFRTFVTGQSYRSVRALDPQVLCYGGYCYGIAIAMVAINISISMYKTNGQEIGYGGRVCYISNPVMVGWVFALPVGVIIILNMGFFFAVVYQISASTMRRRGKQSDRTNTVIYMKLSSLTGVTWIFGYLYLWTNFDPLEYIFIVLNAGQGVFIFISFICTQRISKLYWNLLRKNCMLVRARCCTCLCWSRFDTDTHVEMNTQKVSLTAGSTTKGFMSQSASVKRFFKGRFERTHSASEVDKSKHDKSDIFKGSVNESKAPVTEKKSGDQVNVREMSESNNIIHEDGIQNTIKIATIATIGLSDIDFLASKGETKEPDKGQAHNGHV